MVLMLSCAIVSSLWKRFGVTNVKQLAMCVSRETVMGCHSNKIHKPVQERDSRNVTSGYCMWFLDQMNLFLWAGVGGGR